MAAALAVTTVLAACGNSGNTSNSNSSASSASTTSAADNNKNDDNSASASEESVSDASAEAISARTETEHLIVNWMTWAGSPADLQLVVDEMNALTVPTLNIEIEMQVTDYASRSQ